MNLMRLRWQLLILGMFLSSSLSGEVLFSNIRFHQGDDFRYSHPSYDDSYWIKGELPLVKVFGSQDDFLWIRFDLSYDWEGWQKTPILSFGRYDFPFEVYIDGVLALKDGDFAPHYHYSIGTWDTVSLAPPHKSGLSTFLVAIRISRDGGRVEIPPLYTIDQPRAAFQRTVLDLFNAGIYQILALLGTFIGFFFLVQYAFHQKDKTNLFFALMNFCFSVYFVRIGSPLEFLPYLRTFSITKAALYPGLAFVFFFFTNYFSIWNHKILKRVVAVSAAVLFVWVALSPQNIEAADRAFSVTLFPVGSLLVGVLIMTILAVRRKKQDAIVLMVGSLCAVGFGIHDILYQVNGLLPLFWLQGFGIFGLNISMFIAVAIRSIVTLRELEISHIAIREKNEVLKKMDAEKDNILANTSHELRTPLVGILGLSQELLEDEVLGPKQRKSLVLIQHSASRLKQLINDILEHSKLKNKEIHIYFQNVDLVGLLENVVRMVMPMTGTKKVNWKISTEKNLPMVLADPARLEQIIFNLWGNAIKFTKVGYIEAFAFRERGRVTVGIRDTGLGIAPENLSRVFESFSQGDPGTEREYGGTGLGLSITRDLVRLHQSELVVESELGKGSTFSFSLAPVDMGHGESNPETHTEPIIETKILTTETISPERKKADPPASFMAPGRIPPPQESSEIEGSVSQPLVLVVDDEPINLEVIKGQFRRHHYQIVTMLSGQECLDFIQKVTVPDLIILDVMMPKMTGFDVLREIRKHYSILELPVLFLTAKTEDNDLTEGFSAGANDYLPKPSSKAEILARVDHHLSMSQVYKSSRGDKKC